MLDTVIVEAKTGLIVISLASTRGNLWPETGWCSILELQGEILKGSLIRYDFIHWRRLFNSLLIWLLNWLVDYLPRIRARLPFLQPHVWTHLWTGRCILSWHLLLSLRIDRTLLLLELSILIIWEAVFVPPLQLDHLLVDVYLGLILMKYRVRVRVIIFVVIWWAVDWRMIEACSSEDRLDLPWRSTFVVLEGTTTAHCSPKVSISTDIWESVFLVRSLLSWGRKSEGLYLRHSQLLSIRVIEILGGSAARKLVCRNDVLELLRRARSYCDVRKVGAFSCGISDCARLLEVLLTWLERVPIAPVSLILDCALEVEEVGLEVLRLRNDSPLKGWKLIINRHLIAFNEPFPVVSMLALLCIVNEVLVIDCPLLYYEYVDRLKRSHREILYQVNN